MERVADGSVEEARDKCPERGGSDLKGKGVDREIGPGNALCKPDRKCSAHGSSDQPAVIEDEREKAPICE
jgi:hypothetical protein